MNDIYARRLAQSGMFHQLMRIHGTLWTATSVTHEKLDLNLVKEEFMRTNGRRAMPQLVGAAARVSEWGDSHLTSLSDHCSWAESGRAYAVQRQTPMTQHIAAMGRMSETIPQCRTAVTCQSLFGEHMCRIDGVSAYEEEPLINEEDT